MITIHQKHQILESLDSMDAEQTEKVLTYIKRMLNLPSTENSYQHFKRKALNEIRQALEQPELVPVLAAPDNQRFKKR
jgi:hypothetical protein